MKRFQALLIVGAFACVPVAAQQIQDLLPPARVNAFVDMVAKRDHVADLESYKKLKNAYPLVGLKKLHVLVNRLDPEINKAGLTKPQLEADTIASIKKVGLEAEKEVAAIARESGAPILAVNVSSAPQADHFVFTISVNYNEVAYSERTGRRCSMVPVWSETSFGTGTSADARSDVKNLVTEFCADFQRANP